MMRESSSGGGLSSHCSVRVAGQRRRADHEVGASTVETALVMPVLLLVFFAIVQGAISLHAGTIAHATAQAVYEAARLHDASLDDAIVAGHITAANAGDALTDLEIEVQVDGGTVTVTVTGAASSLVPGMPIMIERTVSGPREQWV